jgi:hypothetical protein
VTQFFRTTEIQCAIVAECSENLNGHAERNVTWIVPKRSVHIRSHCKRLVSKVIFFKIINKKIMFHSQKHRVYFTRQLLCQQY